MAMTSLDSSSGGAAAPTLLARVGTSAWSIAKHVPTRATLWAAIGFGLALAVLIASVALSVLTFGHGAWRMAQLPFVVVPGAIALTGVAILAGHGLQRGVARATLALAHEFQLVRYVTDRVLALIAARLEDVPGVASAAALIPAARLAIAQYAGADSGQEGEGLGGWVLRRVRRMLARVTGTRLLDHLGREDLTGDRSALLLRVGDRVAGELEGRLAEAVMAPLDRQRNLILITFVVAGSLWFHTALGLLALVNKLRG